LRGGAVGLGRHEFGDLPAGAAAIGLGKHDLEGAGLELAIVAAALVFASSPSAANAEPAINVAATAKARTAESELRMLVMVNLLFGPAPRFEELIEEEFRGRGLNPA
jgi:hypothetical protein